RLRLDSMGAESKSWWQIPLMLRRDLTPSACSPSHFDPKPGPERRIGGLAYSQARFQLGKNDRKGPDEDDDAFQTPRRRHADMPIRFPRIGATVVGHRSAAGRDLLSDLSQARNASRLSPGGGAQKSCPHRFNI